MAKEGIKTTFGEITTEGTKTFASARMLTRAAGRGAGLGAGVVTDGIAELPFAGYTTYQSRLEEKTYKETGGATGFSRTKANKEITSTWSSAGVGVAGCTSSVAVPS